jgi:hypothetical protein
MSAPPALSPQNFRVIPQNAFWPLSRACVMALPAKSLRTGAREKGATSLPENVVVWH